MTKDKIRSFINAVKNVRDSVSDEVALENMALYAEWKTDVVVKVGDRVQYNGKLYKVLQDHTTQITWTPTDALTLFEPIDGVNDGSLERPFIASLGMTYHKDKYYLDETDGKIYKCVRDDTGNGTALYHMPNVLAGDYFAVVE